MTTKMRNAEGGMRSGCRGQRDAFTLIEIMIVVGIIALVMTTSIPFVRSLWHKENLRKAVDDILEVCGNARSRAIMQGVKTEVVFHPKDGSFSVSASAGPSTAAPGEMPHDFGGGPPPAPANSGLSGKIPENILIEMLDINLTEYRDTEEARVIFYPNGTCDELTIILHSDQNEYRKISFEVTTSLAVLESDPHKFK